MTFHSPWFLFLFLLIPGMVYLRYARKRRNALRYSNESGLQHIPPGSGVLLQPLMPILYTLGLALLVIALARPQKGLDESTVRTEAVDIVLLLDVSTSMLAEDMAAGSKTMNRFDASIEVIERFIGKRAEDRIGIVAFAAMPYSVAPLTLDHDWLFTQMDRVKPGMLEDGTAIGSAIASAVNRLRDSKAVTKLVILLTDGVNNSGTLTPANAAQAAKALGVKVYTVGAGTTGPVRMPVNDPFFGTRYTVQNSEIDEASLKQIAEITDAQYFRATDFKSLNEVYSQIDEMEKTEMEVEQYTRYEELFAGFAWWSLALLVLEKLLSLTRLRRLP